jgi:hypothetical protein
MAIQKDTSSSPIFSKFLIYFFVPFFFLRHIGSQLKLREKLFRLACSGCSLRVTMFLFSLVVISGCISRRELMHWPLTPTALDRPPEARFLGVSCRIFRSSFFPSFHARHITSVPPYFRKLLFLFHFFFFFLLLSNRWGTCSRFISVCMRGATPKAFWSGIISRLKTSCWLKWTRVIAVS